MTTQALRGSIEPLALVDVLAYLGRTGESGVLNIQSKELRKSVVIHEGQIIFARSNQVQDRLGDILLAKGQITQQQYDDASALIFEKRYRHGRALVEIGAISPKLLWMTIQDQIKTITCSIIPLESGVYEFIRQEIKQVESITVQLPILDLVIDLVRHLDNRQLFRSRLNNPQMIFCKTTSQRHTQIELEPYEQYILNFLDGQTPIGAICRNSDIGEDESLRVIYLLQLLGFIERASQENPVKVIHPLIQRYNSIFQYIGDYLGERVGSVGGSLLKKLYQDTKATHAGILDQVILKENGSLDEYRIQENFEILDFDEAGRVMALEEALDEFLYSGVLAVKKLLGPEHESAVLKNMESLS